MSASRVWFLVQGGGLAVRQTKSGVELPTDEDALALGLRESDAHELGPMGGVPAVAAAIDELPASGSLEIARLRDLYAVLGDARFMMAGCATQVIEWATTHRFCGRCGARTERASGERCMKCAACGLLGYPRIAPAVIVLVRRGDEALLARGARFPGAFYSTLAGFVEIGESLEQTIVREVREEVGVEVKSPRYFGSQAWPFPHSLMVGFFADWAAGDIRPDGAEIVDARWYRADALPEVPPKLSIARHLIDAWVSDVTQSS